MNNNALSQKLAQHGAAMTPSGFDNQVRTWFKENGKKMATLAGSDEEAKKLIVAAINTVSRIPKLMECDFTSFCNCLLTSATLRLYPGPMQECAYIPFGRIATFVPMYQGLVKLAYNAGFIKRIASNVVWNGEHFMYQEGMNPVLEHIPDFDIDHDNGTRKCVYCVVKTRYDDVQMAVLSPRFINGIRARSRGAAKPDSPWNGNADDIDWMWKKTALKQALKLLPKSAELNEAIKLDDISESERAETKKISSMNALIDNIQSDKLAISAGEQEKVEGESNEQVSQKIEPN